ncbi:MAG: acyloxyacyl hydrolase [Gammaproteobacteria bacterium]|nr:acyloxyacyl hydrolase [Gammaproteobacteria bacterium]
MSRSLFFAPFFSLFITFPVFAKSGDQEIILSAGKGLDNTLMQAESISSADMLGISWSYQFYDFLNQDIFQLWFQASYSYLRISHFGERQDQNVFELKPVLRWAPCKEAPGLFAEAGVGAGYLSNKDFGDIYLPTKLNFALHFAMGYRFSNRHLLSMRYSHFSNANTNNLNPGFDFASLNWHFNF